MSGAGEGRGPRRDGAPADAAPAGGGPAGSAQDPPAGAPPDEATAPRARRRAPPWLSPALHGGVVAALLAAQLVLPEYQRLSLTRIMVLAVYAMGFNVAFGYAGLLSLGHAMFFAAGLYGAGLTVYHLDWPVWLAFVAGVTAGAALSAVVGAVALRTKGVAFMIVTLMFAQTAYLATLHFTTWTRGDEGLTLTGDARTLAIGPVALDLADATVRYNLAWGLLAATLLITHRLARGRLGRALIAVRENEARTAMLGYDTFALRWRALVISGTLSAASGAAYALLFAYVGSSFAAIQTSIEPLLYTLLGGPGTVLGPVLGTGLMFTLIDVASDVTTAHLLAVGAVLIALVLFFPKGLLGTLRDRIAPWLP